MTMRSVFVVCTVIASLPAVTVAQEHATVAPRSVLLEASAPNDPVKIVRVMWGSVDVKPGMHAWPADKPGTAFLAGDDWLKEVSAVVKNTSPSKIVFLSIDAHLPETGAGTQESPQVAAGNSVGQKPEHAMYSALTGQQKQEPVREPINLEPGKELIAPIIGEHDYENIKQLIHDKQALSSVKRCEVWVTTVFFADGTKWASSTYWRPEEGRPGKYTAMSFEDWLEMEHAR